MIEEFVARFQGNPITWDKHPEHYQDIVRKVVGVIHTDEEYDSPDPNRIHMINDGSYQGTLLFIIGAGGYQPDKYWFVKVGYGSCSVCDTFEAIRGWNDEITQEQIADYNKLALHIVQKIKLMDEESV